MFIMHLLTHKPLHSWMTLSAGGSCPHMEVCPLSGPFTRFLSARPGDFILRAQKKVVGAWRREPVKLREGR